MINANVEVGGVLRAFDRLKRIDKAKVFRDARTPMRVDQRMHAKARSGPGGRWTPLASTTIERRTRSGKHSRRLLGRLPTALKLMSDSRRVRAESLVRWSRVHQDGGRAGHGSKIPAREFLWLSTSLVRIVGVMFKRALERAWKGR